MFQLENLSSTIRSMMMTEVESDQTVLSEYYGRRLTSKGIADWQILFRNAVVSGNPESLAYDLRSNNRLKNQESRTTGGQTTFVDVPWNAADILAQGEFNRYYIRAVCQFAVNNNLPYVEVYRARDSENPRVESERMIGNRIDPKILLDDIKTHPGAETNLGIPLVNSGLSVRLPKIK